MEYGVFILYISRITKNCFNPKIKGGSFTSDTTISENSNSYRPPEEANIGGSAHYIRAEKIYVLLGLYQRWFPSVRIRPDFLYESQTTFSTHYYNI